MAERYTPNDRQRDQAVRCALGLPGHLADPDMVVDELFVWSKNQDVVRLASLVLFPLLPLPITTKRQSKSYGRYLQRPTWEDTLFLIPVVLGSGAVGVLCCLLFSRRRLSQPLLPTGLWSRLIQSSTTRRCFLASILFGCLGNILTILVYGSASLQAVQLLRCMSPLLAAVVYAFGFRHPISFGSFCALSCVVGGVVVSTWKVSEGVL